VLGGSVHGEHVERGTADPAFAQRCEKGGLVDERAAGDVDQVCAGFHRAQHRRINQAAVASVSVRPG